MRKNRFKFTEKTQSKKGIATLAAAVVLLIAYIVVFTMAFRSYGTLSPYVGCVGIFAILATIVLVVTSIQSIRDENSYQLIPHLALIFTILEGICWIGTFVVGMR